tara:strand:+ start:2647 stop:3015 length:369 start_codon:yes stop_codon:yes gene_type:complete
MELKQRYIKDKGYDVEDEFMDELKSMDSETAIAIAYFIENNVQEVKPNELATYIFGGLVYVKNQPITFALEIMKVKYRHLTFTDINLITMDEYLDLILENSYIKSNENNTKTKSNRKTHRVL